MPPKPEKSPRAGWTSSPRVHSGSDGALPTLPLPPRRASAKAPRDTCETVAHEQPSDALAARGGPTTIGARFAPGYAPPPRVVNAVRLTPRAPDDEISIAPRKVGAHAPVHKPKVVWTVPRSVFGTYRADNEERLDMAFEVRAAMERARDDDQRVTRPAEQDQSKK